MAILMFVDGVLRSQTGSPIYQGLAIYRLLTEDNRVLLICEDKKKDDVWLRSHKINKIDDLIGRDIPAITDEFPEWRQVEYCRGQGSIDFVVTSNPVLAKKLLEVGITTMVFMQPTYITEGFRPDSKEGRKTWDDIVEEITYQQEHFIEDPRIKPK